VTKHDEFLLIVRIPVLLEQTPDDRGISRKGNPVGIAAETVLDQPRDRQRLAFAKFHRRLKVRWVKPGTFDR
jgi:hypothetical protein